MYIAVNIVLTAFENPLNALNGGHWPGILRYRFNTFTPPSYVRYNPRTAIPPVVVGFHNSRGSTYGGFYNFYMAFTLKTQASFSTWNQVNLFGAAIQVNFGNNNTYYMTTNHTYQIKLHMHNMP